MRNFPYEPIFYSWYRDENNSIFEKILIEFSIKNNLNRFVKLLFAAAETIRYEDPDERHFLHRLNLSYNKNIKQMDRMDQNQHLSNMMAIYIDGLRKFGLVPLT